MTSGVIAVDGKDINAIDLAGLRSLFGIVSQETVLFNETVREQYAYGTAGASVER